MVAGAGPETAAAHREDPRCPGVRHQGPAAVALAVVMDGVAPGEEPEAADPDWRAVEGRDRLPEPAERPGADSAQDDPGGPGLPEDGVDAVGLPDPEEADHAPPTDVDHV